ncbi:MAG TPA: ornithine carbamoyltransferase [Thermoanaerobaculia bacterium]|jgi:ornithine carbamoyltransferase|nr:ornithine carbamoyltransferase [Thermoanaerobaculia bacterium]
MTARHVLSIADLGTETLARLVEDGAAIARGEWDARKPLQGKTVGIYFKKSSTRTRTSFTVGAMKLGASTIAYGPSDLQITTGETLQDTARVLSNYLDALVIRTNESIAEMRELAGARVPILPIINAMSDNEHPTQALADLVCLKEAFGRLEDLHVLYIGEGNNTATALALAFGLLPRMHLTLVTPEGYGIPQEIVDQARGYAARSGSCIEQHHDMAALPQGPDIVYSTRWLTMGVQKKDDDWLDRFRPYTITPDVMARVSRPGTLFMHDLPAMRGYEVVDEVLDGPQSIAFRQAYHKMTSAMAVLNWCVNGN